LVEGAEIQKMVKEVADIPGILAINKSDLDATWHWSENELFAYQESFAKSFQTSAKTGENVEELFEYLASLLA
jgi:GTPase Era involved in 16S rRNA processing